MAKVTIDIDCETYLKLINGTASEGGTTSGGDYTSSDTSSGQSGSGSSKKTSSKKTSGKKNQTKPEIDFSCNKICIYQTDCRENKLDWRWLAAMDCCYKKFMGKGIADLHSAARIFTKYANKYQSRTLERYEWKNCYFFGAIAYIMGAQSGGDSADALKLLEEVRYNKQAPTINNLITALKYKPFIKYNLMTGESYGPRYAVKQRNMFVSYGRCVLTLFAAIRLKYTKGYDCVPTTKLNFGNWDWGSMTIIK